MVTQLKPSTEIRFKNKRISNLTEFNFVQLLAFTFVNDLSH